MNLQQRLLLALACLCLSPSLWAATYSYQGPTYASKIDFTSPCGTGPCANYALGQNITGQFTTAAPLPPNLFFADVHANVTSYSFTDGVNSYSSSDPNTRLHVFAISTDAAGNILAATSWVQIQLWLTGSSPHAPGDRAAVLGGCRPAGGCTGGGEDRAVPTSPVLQCKLLGRGGNIAPDSCSGGMPDISVSSANVAASSFGTWSILAESPIPTLSEWALILLALLVAGFALWALSFGKRRESP
ncbi:MAG: IPTL-CTERM sorting domain-containing protein [Gammaproteobacteria bacterium]|nr:IPTL-CTERM sorting domain-containing protein [Gammaproteobacteria bacterium]